jgi:hypothetical protein
MNRVLRRPMFRMGGSAEGITSGLAPRQGYANNNAADQRVQHAPRTGMSDFLINFGLDLASRPPSGSIFSTAAAAAKDPFKQYQASKAAQEKMDWERDWEQEGRDIKAKQFEEEIGLKREGLEYEKTRDVADRELQKYLGEIEAKGKTQWIVEELDKYWDAKISAVPPGERSKLQALKAEERREILRGYDISDTMAILRNTAAFEEASDLARGAINRTINPDTGVYWDRTTDAGYADEVLKLTQRYLRQIAEFLKEEGREFDATGGRVGYQNAGAVMPGQPMQAQAPGPTDQGETNEINISYEQLRERLPPEISNEIVLLLSQSYEAFADFAEIQTQADVNEFNTKYNVQLFLPKQAGA